MQFIKRFFNKFLEKRRFKEEIEACSYYLDYKKAWDIVNELGSEEIIKEMKNFIKYKA